MIDPNVRWLDQQIIVLIPLFILKIKFVDNEFHSSFLWFTSIYFTFYPCQPILYKIIEIREGDRLRGGAGVPDKKVYS
jgi:hypothetical protein